MENKLAIRYKTVGLTGMEKTIETFIDKSDGNYLSFLQRNPNIYALEVYTLTKIEVIKQ